MNLRHITPEIKTKFLQEVANEHGFFQRTREVFLARFTQDDAGSKNTEIANSLGMDDQEFQDYLSQVCQKLGFTSTGRGRSRKGESPWEKAFTWLWNTKFNDSSDSDPQITNLELNTKILIHRQVCQAILAEKQQLSSNPLTTGNGTTFNLQDIYVPLGLIERKRQPKRKDDIPAEEGSKLYQPAEDEITRKFEQTEFFEQVLKLNISPKSQGKRIAIIGEPGAGKTTILQQIVDWVFDNTEQDVAIWISLADLQGKTIEDYLLQIWLKSALKRARVTPDMEDSLVEMFNRGRVWLLLDGVDEMTVDNPLKAIASQITTGWVSSARMVLTCRLNVWDVGKNVLERFDTYRTLEFSYGDEKQPNSDQVNQFISKWFSVSKPLLAKTLRIALDQPGKERIKDLVKNPLRLTLMCYSWQRRQGELPKTKAALYQRFVDVFYEWKQEQFPITSATRQELNQALGRLAMEAIAQSSSRFRLTHRFICQILGQPDAPLFQLVIKLGWLNQIGVADEDSEEPVYAFYHPTFQEYFAALVIDDWHYFLKDVPDHPELGIYRIFEPQWKEVILLWLGRFELLKQQKEDFIKALVDFKDGCWYFYRNQAYLLAAAGMAEFRECSLCDQIVGLIVDCSFQGVYVNDKQLILDEAKSQYHGFIPMSKTSENFREWIDNGWQKSVPEIEAVRKVLKETDREKAIAFLVDIILKDDDKYKHEEALLLGQIDPKNEIAISYLTQFIQPNWYEEERIEAAYQLWQINPNNEMVVTTLVDIIQNYDTEGDNLLDAAKKLAEIAPRNETVIEYLVNEIHTNQDEYSLWLFATSLGKIDPGNKTAIAILIELMNKTKEYCRNEKLYLDSLRYENMDEEGFWYLPSRCHLSARSLGEIDPGNEIAIAILFEIIDSDEFILEPTTCCELAESLGRFNFCNEKAITILIYLIYNYKDEGNEDWEICLQALTSLGEIGINNKKAISALVDIIETNEDDESCLLEVAKILGKIDTGNEIAITTLIKLIINGWDEDEIVAENLEEILKGNHFSKVVIGLKHYMIDQVFETNCYFYIACYNVLQRCAENMSYPDFYHVWHNL